MARKPKRRNGFVLLVTLVTLAIAGLLLASLANRSLTLAMQAETEAAETQLHWGAVSVREAVVQTLAEVPTQQPAVELSEEWDLNGVTFRVVVENENTKLNLNRLLPTLGNESLAKLTQCLTSADIKLSPSTDTASLPFTSGGQVFAFDDKSDGQLTVDWLRKRARHMTCFGNGRIDYLATDERVVRALFEAIEQPIVGQKLLQATGLNSTKSLDDVLEFKAIDEDSKRVLQRWITDKAEFRTIWLVGETRTRIAESLSVVDLRSPHMPQVQTFSW
ncbi:MAG: hypothetical protein KDB27_15860, partial [Planctomycetales bacterium]|nr:hypothetical protein [Planctomycetales bacterium]